MLEHLRTVYRPQSGEPLDLAFVVGAHRSGTTWLATLLSAHPHIAAGPESHLFSQYLHHTWHRWFYEEQFLQKAGGMQGMAYYLTRAEFEALLQYFARVVFLKVKHAKPGARTVLEKTPDHSLCLPLIRTLFPHSRVVHILRDPRDVIASQLAAGQQDWGKGWAPTDATEAARTWVEYVQAIRADAAAYPSLSYEIRYEDLLGRGPQTLGGVFDFLGLHLPDEQVQQIIEMCGFDRSSSGRGPKVTVTCGERRESVRLSPDNGSSGAPPGFYRKGKSGSWQESLTAEQIEQITPILAPWLGASEKTAAGGIE